MSARLTQSFDEIAGWIESRKARSVNVKFLAYGVIDHIDLFTKVTVPDIFCSLVVLNMTRKLELSYTCLKMLLLNEMVAFWDHWCYPGQEEVEVVSTCCLCAWLCEYKVLRLLYIVDEEEDRECCW